MHNRKRNLIYIGVATLTLLTCLMLIEIINKKEDLYDLTISKQTLPNFTFYNLEGIATNTNFIAKNNAVCIFYFNADCEHCQYEAKEISKNITVFKHTQVVMVSFNTIADIKKFAQRYRLNYPNITFLQDPKYQFYKWFGKTGVPAVFIYNAQHKLVKEYHGETKIEAILKCL